MKNLFLFWYWEAEIPPAKCQQFIDELFVKSKIQDGLFEKHGKSVRDDTMRKTDVVCVKENTEFLNLIFTYIASANKQVWNYDLSGMEDVQLGRYEIGGHYDWHLDSDEICLQGFQRKLSCSVQLTDEDQYEGGDLVLQNCMGNEEFTMPKKQGSIIVFPSAVKHKVTPVVSGTRFSAAAWMRGPAFR
jgi:PKHD-type hydroxylase